MVRRPARLDVVLWDSLPRFGDRTTALVQTDSVGRCFRRMPARCLIDAQYAEPDTEVTVGWGNPGDPRNVSAPSSRPCLPWPIADAKAWIGNLRECQLNHANRK